MKNTKAIFLSLTALSLVTQSHAQGWGNLCIDPANTTPRTTPYIVSALQNSLFRVFIGRGGSVTYGGATGPCFNPAVTYDNTGRFGFMVGGTGSVQTDFDDNLALTMGMPVDPAGDHCFAEIITQNADFSGVTKAVWGTGGFGFFIGASQRYWNASWRDTNSEVNLEVRLIGDSARFKWRLRNISGTVKRIGMKFAAAPHMITFNGSSDLDGFSQSHAAGKGNIGENNRTTSDAVPYTGFTELPNGKPVRTEKNWLRANPRFPEYVNFQWSQKQPYGLRVDNTSTPSTPDATDADQFLVGEYNYNGSTGLILNNNVMPRVFSDFGQGDALTDVNFDPIKEESDIAIESTAFIQGYKPTLLSPGSSNEIIQYFRSSWSVGDYLDPYSVLIDAPRLIEPSAAGVNGLGNNPFRVVAYLDNQYSVVDAEIPLNNVRIKMNLPANGGLSLAPGEPEEKLIASIAPNAISSVEWNLVADGKAVGKLPYSITFSPTPGPSKTVSGTVLVSATPLVRLAEGANFLSFPWTFIDTSLDSIFGPVGDPNALRNGVDYLAYRWEPSLGTYLPATSVNPGASLWIIPLTDLGYRALNGATTPASQGTGGITTTLQTGWNQIGNPYSIPVPVSQLVGVGEADPSRSLSWSELVDNGWVSGSLAYWKRSDADPNSGQYLFTEGLTDVIQPQTGYWVYVTTLQPIRISWPGIFTAGFTGSDRSVTKTFKQTDKEYRLNLVARSNSGIDATNFVGVTTSAKQVESLRIYEPPAAPESDIQMSIAATVNGKSTRLAQSFSEKPGKKSFELIVTSKSAGDVTVSWPNMASLPRNVRVQLTDQATNTVRDLRFSGGYTFKMDAPGTRSLKVELEPGGAQRALIGSVVVTRPQRSPNAPISISYNLSADALTTVRVLNGSGTKEVYTIRRSREASAGANEATWNLKDNANRTVPPGAYQIEVVAETSTGERVRKVVPVTLTR